MAPNGLMTELLKGQTVSGITNPAPKFGWIVHSSSKNDIQSAYRILVASDLETLNSDTPDMWDSKKTSSGASINVSYQDNVRNRNGIQKILTG